MRVQLVAALCQVQPGQWVAGCVRRGRRENAGFLVAGMKNQGRLVALDIHDWRLEDAKKRLHRAGATTRRR